MRSEHVPAGDTQRRFLLERERRDVLWRFDSHSELRRDGARREVKVRKLVEANKQRV